eukprot:TRINITY_DN4091_c0_g1_i1.p1 TRINITY_DN4091_c0_g1~~TRINITY_DN4091_c0_g1_i1.p1  ORF type:complete len:815 (-),score=222.43 TRINITY_DN4091_c0_g1_i1:45-2489(-)
MRILIKGGVWKNTEDEILKAAVMKYGKNQWARISSLLVRKSAKQCKARWYEWLDPSIKKTEWSREEEEKLLHLAKLMPTQWRTIAPIVGRTASQCLEHYEKLLDAAQEKDETYDPADDPRRLRPGEIDPNPESKPARPDPVDMDEDEKEMLSEARARLANTKGKKAKRKAREKQLEEARRLAALQKRRELKAAGIDLPQRKKKLKGIDYNKEIPFQKKPPPGFFDVSVEEDVPPPDPSFKNISLGRMEGKRRADDETKERKKDSKKHRINQMKNLPAAIMQINKLNDPEQICKHTQLNLPAPQLSDRELEQIAKLGYEPTNLLEDGRDEEEDPSRPRPTSALLSSYSPANTPVGQRGAAGVHGLAALLKTPTRTPARGDTVLMEAQNLVALTHAKTPLAGGENTPLHPSDFSGASPAPRDVHTQNVLATPLRGASPSVKGKGETPAQPLALTPGRTPVRDQLHINPSTDEGSSQALAIIPVAGKASEKRKKAESTRQLQSAFSKLPQPKNEYSTVLLPEPVSDLDHDTEEQLLEDDSSDVLMREQAAAAAQAEAEFKARSQVLQRDLPRPLIVNRTILGSRHEGKSEYERESEMIRAEMVALLTHDAITHPLGHKRFKPPAVESLVDYLEFSAEEISEAKELVEAEEETLWSQVEISKDSLGRLWDSFSPKFSFVPSLKAYISSNELTDEQKIESLEYSFKKIKKRMDRENTKAKKLEQRVNLLFGGYQQRAQGLLSENDGLFEQLTQSEIELKCLNSLKKSEEEAIVTRTAGLKADVEIQIQREAAYQLRYANLLTTHNDLKHQLTLHSALTS